MLSVLLGYAFVFGAVVGSFLNVCIFRIPEGLSIVRPGSRCPKCKTPIPFYQNIPIVSWILLSGKCRHCSQSISFRYPAIETLTGAVATALMWRFGLQPVTLVLFLFAAALIVVSFIDLDHRIIPDVVSLPGIVTGFCLSALLPTIGWKASAMGILIGGGSLYAVGFVYALLRGVEGMGGGDIKLLAMIGAFIGWQGVLFTIFIASFSGTLAGAGSILLGGGGMKAKIPFGPFLSFGALLYVFCGPAMIQLYLHWVTG